MSESSGFDPYQPPSAVDSPSQASTIGTGQPTALPDPRLLGNIAAVCISIQVFVKFSMVPGVSSMEWLFIVSAAHIVALVASVISFLVWLYRVASNVRRLNPHTGMNPSWVVGSYFVPFANWVVPIISMRDIVRNSLVHAKPGALESLAVVWWLSFIFSGVAQRFARTDPVVMGIWLLTITVSWIGVIVLITRISRAQAAFRWADLPQSRRPAMVPLGGSRSTGLPSSRSTGSNEPKVTPVSESDIESGWGKG
jgi:Domain of unknown function (DUF4328)